MKENIAFLLLSFKLLFTLSALFGIDTKPINQPLYIPENKSSTLLLILVSLCSMLSNFIFVYLAFVVSWLCFVCCDECRNHFLSAVTTLFSQFKQRFSVETQIKKPIKCRRLCWAVSQIWSGYMDSICCLLTFLIYSNWFKIAAWLMPNFTTSLHNVRARFSLT